MTFLPEKQSPKLFYKKASLNNFAQFTGKRLCWSLFLNKVPGLRPATLSKNETSTQVVSVCKILRTAVTASVF